MSGDKKTVQDYWDLQAKLDPDCSIIDPNDLRGYKNKYLASIRDNEILQWIRQDSTVIDFGAGTGSLSLALCKKSERVFGLDISFPLLQQAVRRKYANDPVFVQIDGQTLPICPGVVDVIVTYGVLCYLTQEESIKNVIREFARVLTTRGRRLVIVEQVRKKRRVLNNKIHVQRSINEYVELLSEAGFKVTCTKITRYGRFPFTPLIAMGLLPKRVWPWCAKLEVFLGSLVGLLPWDYSDVLIVAE